MSDLNYKKKTTEYSKGLIYSFSSFFIWGMLPLYWKLLKSVNEFEIIAHRMIWSFVFLIIIHIIIKKKEIIILLKNKKSILLLLLSGSLIAINWLFFIYAINTNHVVESSLGFYISPIISIIFGLIFLKEKLNKHQWIAVFFVFAGVLYLTIKYGKLPWLALLLACSFALYGLLKKIYNYDSLSSLAVETLFMLPFSIIIIVYNLINNSGSFLNISYKIDILMILTGIVTVIPLILFIMGTKRITLSNLGFIQYISPTLHLLQGLFIFNEKFSLNQLISFILIWIGLLIYTSTINYNYFNPDK